VDSSSTLGAFFSRGAGGGIGPSHHWIREQIEKNSEYLQKLNALHLTPQVGYAFLRLCAHPRISYLNRVMPPSMMDDITRTYDHEIMESFCKIMKLPDLETLQTLYPQALEQIRLSITDGGYRRFIECIKRSPSSFRRHGLGD